jgi:capsular polysaccharide biosynthesis protein
MILGFMAAAAITYLMPKQYESFAIIEIMASPPDPEVPTVMQSLTSPGLLGDISSNLDLPNRWASDDEVIIQLLRKSIITKQIRGTDLIRIRVRHANREDAMDIIRTLLDVYADERRREREAFDDKTILQGLREDIRKQEAVVYNLHLQLKGIPNHITDPASSSEFAVINQRIRHETERLQEMRLKLIGESITSRIPVKDINIHVKPVIAMAPISPNVPFNLALGALSGLLLGFPLALAIMALLHRLTRPS